MTEVSKTAVRRRPATNLRHSHPPKRRGELAELAFMHKAVTLGFGVAKPWGDSDRYDFIIDGGKRLWRAQVRSTAYESHRGYSVHTYVYRKHKMVALTAREIDVVIAYIVPLDLWYVVPVKCYGARKNLWFYPHGSRKGSRFEKYREAWNLINPNPSRRGRTRRTGK
ncbi:MAG: group I intron-associated PD-(D/E)XK endonuclease [Terriglobales bacterium]